MIEEYEKALIEREAEELEHSENVLTATVFLGLFAIVFLSVVLLTVGNCS